MKKFTLLLAGGLIASMSFGQVSWSDDIESYTAGDLIGAAGGANGWTTWSNDPGGSEDAPVSTAEANSGANSVEFTGDVGQDVVLDMGQVYSSGTVLASISVKADSGYYFNFQAGANIGDDWALDIQATDSTLYIYNYDGSFIFHAVIPIGGQGGDWHTFDFEFDLDADSNNWHVSYDDSLVATFTNPVASTVSMMNFYPISAETDFFIDDVSYTHWPTPKSVTFQVDMNYYEGDVGTLHIAGNYLSKDFMWCGECLAMDDTDGDGVWSVTLDVPADSIEWKYLWDNWAVNEALTEGTPCTKTSFGFTNRFLVLTESSTVLDPVCWEQCDSCSMPSGVTEVVETAPVLYPNPTNNVLNVEFGSNVENMDIQVYSLTGQVVRNMNSFSGTKAIINVADLPQGAYFVVGSSELVRFRETFIVQ